MYKSCILSFALPYKDNKAEVCPYNSLGFMDRNGNQRQENKDLNFGFGDIFKLNSPALLLKSFCY